MAYRGFDLSGKLAFVTGASRGIGRAIALLFPLAWPTSDLVTGHILMVDGGWTAQ